ncbi:unnamed protein product [Prunus armeniaca]|uniref:Uncharacterized protein n=1 Tax=Prunus armeniaca TaxID=36596 RepID=A0A6J5VI65_PRUAR|nr:unnamed protein product [Prunus armeniaca]CAB4319003.1 unnamed protein product [Prunus armeniaca]
MSSCSLSCPPYRLYGCKSKVIAKTSVTSPSGDSQSSEVKTNQFTQAQSKPFINSDLGHVSLYYITVTNPNTQHRNHRPALELFGLERETEAQMP